MRKDSFPAGDLHEKWPFLVRSQNVKIFSFNNSCDARAVVPLGQHAGQIDDQGVEQHQPDDGGRGKKAKDPKGQYRQQMGQLRPTGFNQKPPQTFSCGVI